MGRVLTKKRRRRARLRLERELPLLAGAIFTRPERALVEGLKEHVRGTGLRWTGLEKLFVHIPKNGGSSLGQALQDAGLVRVRGINQLVKAIGEFPHGPKLLTLNHIEPGLLREVGLIQDMDWDSVEKIVVFRNPFARAWSAYKHLKYRGTAVRLRKHESFRSFIRSVSKNTYRTRYVDQFGLSHGAPQSQWLSEIGTGLNNRFFYLERPDEINFWLGEQLGLASGLGLANTAVNKSPLPDDFPELNIFLRRFEADFQLGDYSRYFAGQDTSLEPGRLRR